MPNGHDNIDRVPMLLRSDGSENGSVLRGMLSDIELATQASGNEVAIHAFPADEDSGVREAGRGHGSHEHLLKSGPLGMCNDPYCTTCPYSNVGFKADFHRNLSKHAQDRETSGRFWRSAPLWLKPIQLGVPVLNPHSKTVQIWNQIFVVSCLLGTFLDPLFFFLLSVDGKHKCIVLNFNAAASLTAFRSLVDLLYFVHIILQFRLAFKDKLGVLVDDPKLVRARYLTGWFLIDVLSFLPLPQKADYGHNFHDKVREVATVVRSSFKIMVMLVIPKMDNQAATSAGSFKDSLRVIILLQNLPRIIRFYHLIAGRSPTGFVFETAWANFTLNLFLYFLTAHVVGACWYLFGVQRVNACLRHACNDEEQSLGCNKDFLDCGTGLMPEMENSLRKTWINSTMAFDKCLSTDKPPTFAYGIYQPMGYQVAQKFSFLDKYVYSVYWGFTQVSTLAGNLVPSLYPWEALFAMGVGALGLLMFALLIGNMQNFLQSLDRRRHEMQMRRYDVENFMERRQLPLDIRKKVRLAERFKWVTTRGVEDYEILAGLPEDLQMSIKCHLCRDLLKEVRLFHDMDREAEAAIFERLHRRQYVMGSKLLRKGNPVKRMYFIVRGSLSCDDQPMLISFAVPDQHQDNANHFCGEELLLWHLESSAKAGASGRRSGSFWTIGQHAISSQDIVCQDNVDAYVLEGDDAAYISKHYGRLLRTPRVRGILRYESTSCRLWAAVKIQAAWRYRKAKKQRQLKAQAAASRKAFHRSPTQTIKSR